MSEQSIRERFALTPDLIYCNAANLCPTFKAAMAAEMAEYAQVQADPSFEFRDRYKDMATTLRARFARNLNTTHEAIALTRNCSEANGNVVRGIRLKAGDEVILGKENHFSNKYWWLRREMTEGIVVKVAQVPDEPRNPQEVLDSYLSEVTARTRVIALSHQTHVGGIIAPVIEIARCARSRNIWFHLDCAQTFGWMKLDVAAIGCDSMAGSTHKWLMGPLGGGVLYVRPERIAYLDPLLLSVDYYFSGPPAQPSPTDARWFERVGQRADPMLAGLMAALDERDALGGDEAIERIVRGKAAELRQQLSARGVRVIGSGDPSLWGSVLAADIRGLPERAATLYPTGKLAVATTRIGEKPLLRISPHIYNTSQELERLAGLIA